MFCTKIAVSLFNEMQTYLRQVTFIQAQNIICPTQIKYCHVSLLMSPFRPMQGFLKRFPLRIYTVNLWSSMPSVHIPLLNQALEALESGAAVTFIAVRYDNHCMLHQYKSFFLPKGCSRNITCSTWSCHSSCEGLLVHSHYLFVIIRVITMLLCWLVGTCTIVSFICLLSFTGPLEKHILKHLILLFQK